MTQKRRRHHGRDRGCDIADDEIFVSDGSKPDCGFILDILGDQNRIAITDPVYPVYVDTNVMAGHTGQAQKASYTQAQFATYVCSQIPALFDCNNVWIDVESSSSASGVNNSSCVDASGNFISAQYKPGGASDIVVVQLCYKWPIFVTSLGYNIANLPGSMRLLSASAAFRNEPYNN